jgi:Sec7-like guanine-nucleotide exchange factor
MSLFDSVEQQRIRKQELQKSIQKFNYKPAHGIKYMIAAKLVNESTLAHDLAVLFQTTAGFSYEKMGEFFGSDHQFNQ